MKKTEPKLNQPELNKIHLRDCIEGMMDLPDNSVDLVIADPPYNVSKGNVWKWDNSVKLQGFGGDWKKVMEDWDNMTLADFWSFTEMWLDQIKRVLKPTGSMWVYGTYHNIGITNVIMQKLGIEILNEVIWYKRNSFPNLSGRRFTASHENLLWGHVGGKKRDYYYNYKKIKDAHFPEDSLKAAGKQMRTVWDIPNNKERIELKFGKHPTQKPIRVCKRIILATSKPGDTILVPFCGAGSECVAAKVMNRNFISFEIDPKYIEIASKRLENVEKDLTLFNDETLI